jgi:hypothetical protein
VAELIVVGFKKDMYRASEVLNKLLELHADWALDLHDPVAVYRDYKSKLRVDQSFKMTTSEGAAWGGFWGLLIGVTLAIPFVAGASATPFPEPELWSDLLARGAYGVVVEPYSKESIELLLSAPAGRGRNETLLSGSSGKFPG